MSLGTFLTMILAALNIAGYAIPWFWVFFPMAFEILVVLAGLFLVVFVFQSDSELESYLRKPRR